MKSVVIKVILIALGLSVIFVVLGFLGGEPASARGFYYAVWLLATAWLWKKRDRLGAWLQRQSLSDFALFMGCGILMILAEETLAGIFVNLLSAKSLGELLASIPPYYANNLLLLPGFILAWYLLLRRYAYTNAEVFTLVGLFGLFSEKTYLHVLNFPVMGGALILPTMFTYMGIIIPSVFALRSRRAITPVRTLNRPLRLLVGFVFPIIVSIPFVFIHTLLTNAGLMDPTILTR